MDTGNPEYRRKCPSCDVELVYKWKQSFVKAERLNQVCYKCRPLHWRGKTHTKETRQKMSASSPRKKTNLGKKFTDEHRKNISEANKGNKSRLGKPHTEQTKQKLRDVWVNKIHPNCEPTQREKFRELHHQRVINRSGQITPNYNSTACRLFDEINRELGWNGQHAENGGEYQVRGWFLDYYEPTQNVIIEFDEPHHKRTRRQKKDVLKETEVKETLGCRFYRIRSEDRDNWQSILSEVR